METVLNFFKKKDGSWNYPKAVVIALAVGAILYGIAKALIGG